MSEAARRRTFAIISHPDAGKTTLTEKLLLYGGAVEEAGAVKARRGRRAATSDWMELERARGISITSTVLRFSYRDAVLNLLDTPGHRDFSEDTYRVLAAADCAVMVIDAAKGVEPQTVKLYEVCAVRGIPIVTFVNKLDRPGRDPLTVLDEIEERLGIRPTPVTWPVGIPGDLRGVIDRRDGTFTRFVRTARGATRAPEEVVDAAIAAAEEGEAWSAAFEEAQLLDAVGADFDADTFLGGKTTPLFAGSALTNFGVRHLLDALVDLAPSPAPAPDRLGARRPLDAPFSGLVFKVQANMDPRHRDRVAFVRVQSGTFRRGMTLVHVQTGRPFSTNYATEVLADDRQTIDEAYPGDVVGLVNAGGLRVGDSLFESEPVEFPALPSFAPEHFAQVRPAEVDRAKQFQRGLTQLEEEGVVQVLRDERTGDPVPVLAAVGPLQFEVAAHRLEHEFGARVELFPTQHRFARRTDPATADSLRHESGVRILTRTVDGALLALFESPYRLDRIRRDHPDYVLEPLVGDPAAPVGDVVGRP
ncbi:MAG TPA: peptide chain release factor 3 [Acidimicrobiia bacterium]|nr:peptide chain release factor 3 [Acidimicrobiia bacterium]